MAKYELNSAEERYQPGSGDLVLANKLGITDEEEMEALESGLLLMLYEQLFIEDVFGVGVWITGFDVERLAEWLQVHLY